MIVKERKVPITVRKLEALLRRLPPDHRKRPDISDQLARRMAGYRGELAIDYHLGYLLKKDYLIFNDLRLTDGERFFQIDTLILSPHYFLILEVKNISGTLVFDHNYKQLIRVSGEKEEGFADPVLQVERHRVQLQDWLSAQKLPQVPIEMLVVMSNPNTVIKNTLLNLDPSTSKRVIHGANLLLKIKMYEKMHVKEQLNPQQIKKLSRKLVNSHTPSDPQILQQIHKEEILTGVECPECSALPMIRLHAKWVCTQCGSFSKDAHFAAITDYKLLIGLSVSNSELRSFLHLSSVSVSSRILQSMNLSYTGTYRNRNYLMTLDE
ncbi:nuclease-related domain-containing protein [Fictibacillus sp. KU28468]|uniref:nuclease-related domain-containing protein n=1 Tax=Fictibacillus sp. KU28468 TaxID=2991053 RepID=UPI00223D8F76|nr:nuclease-related domain-containing protein [Fictibacillus sp. KU28468]UZJ79403.1 NERD domain-containing protein [Fictibacillus sp. KU28468]